MMVSKNDIEMIGYNDSKAIGIYGNIKLFPVFVVSLMLSIIFLIFALFLKRYELMFIFILPFFELLIMVFQYLINTNSKKFLEDSIVQHKFLLKYNVLYKDGVEVKSVDDICLYKFKRFLFLVLKNSYYRINNNDFIVGSREEFLSRLKYKRKHHIMFLLPKISYEEKVELLFNKINLKDKNKVFCSPNKQIVIYIYKNKAGSYSIGKEKMTLATDDEIESLGAYGWWEEDFSFFYLSYYDSIKSALNDIKLDIDSYSEIK